MKIIFQTSTIFCELLNFSAHYIYVRIYVCVCIYKVRYLKYLFKIILKS